MWTDHDEWSERVVGFRSATVWYQDGGYLWRVRWQGQVCKEGTGCLDRAEAKRECDFWLDEMAAGRVDAPWKASAERQALEDRLLRARARDRKDPLF